MNRLTAGLAVVLLGMVMWAVAPGYLPAAAPQQTEGSWSGKLVDASCKQQHATAACPVLEETSAFGIVMEDGSFVKFDSEGNQKAGEAVRTLQKPALVDANVTGIKEGGQLQVATIQVS